MQARNILENQTARVVMQPIYTDHLGIGNWHESVMHPVFFKFKNNLQTYSNYLASHAHHNVIKGNRYRYNLLRTCLRFIEGAET